MDLWASWHHGCSRRSICNILVWLKCVLCGASDLKISELPLDLPPLKIISCSRHKDAQSFASLHKERPLLADGIRADTGRPARLHAIAPSSRAVVCLTTRRTGEQTGMRATATIYPRAVWHGNHCHNPDNILAKDDGIAPRLQASAFAIHFSQTPLEAASSVARGLVLNTYTKHTLPPELGNMVGMIKTTTSANLCRL